MKDERWELWSIFEVLRKEALKEIKRIDLKYNKKRTEKMGWKKKQVTLTITLDIKIQFLNKKR